MNADEQLEAHVCARCAADWGKIRVVCPECGFNRITGRPLEQAIFPSGLTPLMRVALLLVSLLVLSGVMGFSRSLHHGLAEARSTVAV